jgi:uncharacterized protein
VITRAARAPGLAFEVVRPAIEPSPLRSDIAAFIGPTRRGPVREPTRVEGWREYRRQFGELDRDLDMPYAVRGYFENGGEVAWIYRTGPKGRDRVSSATWDATGLQALEHRTFLIDAASPGAWSKRARVRITYRGRTTTNTPTLDVTIRTDDEVEEHRAIRAATFADTINATSRLIRITPLAMTNPSATRAFAIKDVTLDNAGWIEAPAAEDYLDAIEALAEVPEAAIIAFPDLHDIGAKATTVVRAAAASADEQHDRLVLVDLPRTPQLPHLRWHADEITSWVNDPKRADGLKRGEDDRSWAVRWWRSAALYHPWVRVVDPLGGVAQPTRDIPPSGHVAGVMSRLDRERGAHSTPANAPTLGVIDLREEYDDEEHALLNPEGVDLLRCIPSVGFSVWGGRTLDRSMPFVAHRRLVHRLVRAIRRVAEPLVFEVNGPVLWFMFVRAVTAVLLEAWRAGSLSGSRPEEAFRVVCDESTNPQEQIDIGRCVCELELAPAIPMEFILVRVALSRDGALEVLS